MTENNEDYNGQSAGAKDGIDQFDQTGSAQIAVPQQDPGQINAQLLAEIHQKLLKIDPKLFQGIVQEMAQLIQEFRENLPQFDWLQFTSPQAYSNLLSIIQTVTKLAQLMLLNGDLPTDSDVVSHAAQQEIQQVAAQQAAASGGAEDDDGSGADGRGTVPIGTIRTVQINGQMRRRIKTENGWKYVSAGLNAPAGRPTSG